MTAAPEGVKLHVNGVWVEPRFTTNALCAVEQSLGNKSLEDIGAMMRSGQASFQAVRAVFRAVLINDLPTLTDVQAGRLLQEVGGDAAAAAIQEAFDALKLGGQSGEAAIPEANPKGELSFEAGGDRYVLAFHFNAMAELEPLFPGMGMAQIGVEIMKGVSLSLMRQLFRAALIDYRETSLFEAGNLIDRIGLGNVSTAVGKAFHAAFPKVRDPLQEMPRTAEEDDLEPNRQQRRAAASKSGPTKRRRQKAGTTKP